MTVGGSGLKDAQNRRESLFDTRENSRGYGHADTRTKAVSEIKDNPTCSRKSANHF